MRVRKVISPSGVFERSSFPSIKTGRAVHCEGSWEARYARILEASGNVLRFEEQALWIPFKGEKGPSKSPPDFSVTFTDYHHEIHEVKTLRNLRKEGQIERLRAIARASRGLGYKYVTVTDWQIKRQPRLGAAEMICGRGRIDLSPDLVAAAQDLATRGLSIGELRKRLSASNDEICGLILQGHLWIDLDQGLRADNQILGPGWKGTTR